MRYCERRGYKCGRRDCRLSRSCAPAGRSQMDPTPHQSNYDFNDEILPIGASYWATLAEQILAVEMAS